MVAVLRNGRWIDDAEEQASEQGLAPMRPPVGLSPLQEGDWLAQQKNRAELAEGWKQTTPAGDNRPFWAEDAGMVGRDVGRIAANAGAALVTDYMDLGAGVLDLVGQAGSALTGRGWDWGKVMEDSDNPWTTARRDAFRTESGAGQAISNVVRIGTALLSMPKLAAKGAALPFQVVGKVKPLGGIGEAAAGIGNLFLKLDDLANTKRTGMAGAALGAAVKSMQKGTAAEKAASRALRNDWLALTYDDVAKSIDKAPELKGVEEWFSNVRESSKALTQLAKGSTRAKIKTIGQALAWDAFVTFNAVGEGDAEMDETLGDLAYSTNIPWLQQIGAPTTTYAEDAGLVRKAKQMLEGIAVGVVVNGALDMVRVYKYAKNYRRAGEQERALIVNAMNASGDDFGRSIGPMLSGARVAGELPFARPGAGDPPLLPGEAPGADRVRAMDQLYSQLEAQRQSDGSARAWTADRISQQLAQDRAGTPQLPGVAPSPALSPYTPPTLELGGMQGEGGAMASQAIQPVQVQELPQGQLPGTGIDTPLLPSVRQQDRPQGVDPLVQNRLQQMEAGAPPEAEDAAYQQWLLSRREEYPGGPMAGPRAAGETALVGGPIEPARVSDLSRGEPTVTPDTIRSAWERDAFRAWTEAQQLTFEEGPDGVMRSLASKARELMPRTRAGALEYLRKFRPTANQYGVIHAADSAWANFIYERGLDEGWATIDPDTMQFRFNRRTAAELDRGEAAIRQAEALDQADALQLFTERFAGRVAGINQQAEEIGAALDTMAEGMSRQAPRDAAEAEAGRYQAWLKGREGLSGPAMDPATQDALGQMEARDAYDAWEGDTGRQARDAYDAWEADPGRELMQREAIEAGVAADEIDAAEELRLSTADAAALQGATTDDEVVRDMLGVGLDSIEPATVERAATGRGWEVYDRNGELLGTARTRGGAQKIADQQARRDRDALLARARQMEADATDEAMDVMVGNPVYDSEIVGSVKLTDAQISAVQGLLPRLDQLLDNAWLQRRGPSAFYNVNDLGPQRRTFELSQDEMRVLGDGIKAAIQEGTATGPRLRVLRTLADKLDSEVKLLEPQARAQRFVDDVVNDTRRSIEHGEFCDPL